MTTTNEEKSAVGLACAVPYHGIESTESVIAPQPPEDGREWDCQCARCGSSTTFEECGSCGGDGMIVELYESDDEDTEPCYTCSGLGGWRRCLSDEAWCNAHPMPCREATTRGEIEWFTRIERPARTP